jgi:hypothetical protein
LHLDSAGCSRGSPTSRLRRAAISSVVAIAFYEDRDALHDSGEASRTLTPELLEQIGARLDRIEEYEVVLTSRQVRLG